MSEVGILLLRARGTRTKYAVERATRINHRNLLRIERGDTLPTAETVAKLCEHYGIDARQALRALARDRYRADVHATLGKEEEVRRGALGLEGTQHEEGDTDDGNGTIL